MVVRKITVSEVSAFHGLFAAFHEEVLAVPLNHPAWDKFDAEKFGASVISTMNAGVGVFFGGFDNGIPHGFLYGFISNEPFFGCISAQESIWFVDREYRNSSGLDLLFMFENEAKNRGAKIITCGHFPYLNGDKMGRMYRRMGFTHFQEQYGKEL